MHKIEMSPLPGERMVRFVGDYVRFSLRTRDHGRSPSGQAFLRTNLGRAAQVQDEVIRSYANKLPLAGAAWRDVAMHGAAGDWWIELPLAEVGFFQAKAYLIDLEGRQFWPEGHNCGITVHPNHYRTANTVYCAFARMFGGRPAPDSGGSPAIDAQLARLDALGYAVIPPSGKLRDLTKALPHVIETLGCRVLHLLPVNPTPTTYARFGRFGSPYASQDLLLIDPALVEFDRRTTGVDQFRELAYEAHRRGARVFLDIVTNHTGWGSTLQEHHPEWFLREHDGKFACPGAWGVTWEDLVELDHRNPASWEHLAEVFLTWCRRGVDGFRCDAGYKVPMAAWRYITACVRREYPETVFLLEGLGGSWDATESLLTDGGMQWAYSELFQNYSGLEVANYLDYAHRQSQRAGLYIHYSETHDNDRLAKRGRLWSLLRNRLSALASVSGGYGFTCGVEWLATEQINVHSNRNLNWGSANNLLPELARLNRLLAEHPCFFDGAKLMRLSSPDASVYALRRDSEEGLDRVLVLVNTDIEREQVFLLIPEQASELGELKVDLLTAAVPPAHINASGEVKIRLAPGAAHCLSSTASPEGLSGENYRRARACAAFAIEAANQLLPVEALGRFSWPALARRVDRAPESFLATLSSIVAAARPAAEALTAADEVSLERTYPQVVTWQLPDRRRIFMVPPNHWLLIRDDCRFRARLIQSQTHAPVHQHSTQVAQGYVACFAPRSAGIAQLFLERYAPTEPQVHAVVRFLGAGPDQQSEKILSEAEQPLRQEGTMLLLTNGRGGMARLCADLGGIRSKYDCLLGANLHPEVPTDRHIFAKRCRVWLTADRFITPLNQGNLVACEPGPPAAWRFLGNAGDGRTVEVELEVDMLEGWNTTVLCFRRHDMASAMPSPTQARLTVRIDLEDRNFHSETMRNGGADYHFSSHCRPLSGRVGFEFTPATDRQLRVYANAGFYHHEGEWSERIPHPVEQTRGQVGHGDAYSPGWFDLPLAPGEPVFLVVCADPVDPSEEAIRQYQASRASLNSSRLALAGLASNDLFGRRLVLASHQFVARRGEGKTVIAGYPWFLDWGRDTLICARGLGAAGLWEDVRRILITFGRFESGGTLPNSIHGEDASNRDTSDAPLWYGVVCAEASAGGARPLYSLVVDRQGRTILDVLRSIASHYLQGTANGIRVDIESGLVWSPSHFTWMDTNYPAGTPRQGYPIEIQVLWIQLLKVLAEADISGRPRWTMLAQQAEASVQSLFWLESQGYLADCLLAGPGQAASAGIVDTALRSNALFAVSFGIITGEKARRVVSAAQAHLVVPGALRSLAPLPVSPPLPIVGPHGSPLNNPREPYWGEYSGDEDTRRKPAYHNGTAWTWTFPTFCEAVVQAWDRQPSAIAAAKAYLGSLDHLLGEGCLGQLPEIVDGDAPHAQRGCDAQAWGVTEALRVWRWLQSL